MLTRRTLLTLPFAAAAKDAPALRFGVVTDIHHADKDPAANRHYRMARARLEEAVDTFNEQGVRFAVELGDFIDDAPVLAREVGYVHEIDAVFRQFEGSRHYVLGNHCVFNLTKAEFLGAVGRDKSFYSFDEGGVHFIVLDGCCRKDGVDYGRKNYEWTDTFIPKPQFDWLAADLAATRLPTIVFVHQRLDREDNYGIKNSPAVRALLERSGRVRAVFQGHSHQNDLKDIHGIFYVTFRATVEDPADQGGAFAVVEIASGMLRIQGFLRQQSRAITWPDA